MCIVIYLHQSLSMFSNRCYITSASLKIDIFNFIWNFLQNLLTFVSGCAIIVIGNGYYVNNNEILMCNEKETFIMKSTGMVRKIDELGRLVLPIEIRKNMGIACRDAIEIFTDEDKIILKKYEPSCIFCGNADNVTYFRGKLICNECLDSLRLTVR